MGVYSLSKSGINNWSKFSNVAAGNGQTSDLELIGSQFLTANTASVSFTNLQNYSQYKHLQIRYTGKNSNGLAGESIFFRFNGDSAGNYSQHQIYGSGTSVGSSTGPSANYGWAGFTNGTANASAIFNAGIIDILDFASTAKNKTIRSFGGEPTVGYILHRSSAWFSTAAITSIVFTSESGANFLTGSRFSLYGVK